MQHQLGQRPAPGAQRRAAAGPSGRRCFTAAAQPPPARWRRSQALRAAASSSSSSPSVLSISDSLKLVQQLEQLASSATGRLAPKRFPGDAGERVGFIAQGDVAANSRVVVVSEKEAITRVDAEQHEVVGEVAAECSELVALTLWLMAERSKGAASSSHAFLSTLPAATLSPILWSDADLQELLAGSQVLQEALSRKAVLQQQWQDLQQRVFSKDASKFPPGVFNERAFLEAFSVVLAHAVYLPSASCFALVPLVSQLGRTGAEGAGCQVDYDAEAGLVVVTSGGRTIKSGLEVQLYDPRPNGELLLATGTVPDQNPADFLLWSAGLVQADKYYTMKQQILEALGFSASEQFPVFADRFPNQLLAYLRLSRVGDPALFAKVSFDQDVVLSQMNEYEILQIIMGDCRERLQSYTLSFEEDIKLAQQPNLSPQQRLAVKLRLSEKKIISATMEAVRMRLAPIRGIPTKSGAMQDPNSDFKEIFDTLEAIPQAPARLVGSFLSWAKGEQDPDWGKKPTDKPKAPRPW